MALNFAEQIHLIEPIVADFFEGREQLTVCLGSGISRRRMPVLSELIASAFRNIPLNAESRRLFEQYSVRHLFFQRLEQDGVHVTNPCTLEEFRELTHEQQETICWILCETYGDVFGELQRLCQSKRELLDLMDFARFQVGEPDAAHCYVALMVIEARLQRVLTTNWDRLIEIAIERLSDQAFVHVVTLLKNQATWLNRYYGPAQLIAKVHGCATQYPDHTEDIVVTTDDLQAAVHSDWRQLMIRDLLSGKVVFSGYSGSDYTLMVPLSMIQELRAAHQLDDLDYYVAQESALEARGRSLSGDDASHHLRLNANDFFVTMYFAWIRGRLKTAVHYGRGQTRLERAFDWSDDGWTEALDRIEHLLETDFPRMLDLLFGAPEVRSFDNSCQIPVDLSSLRQLFLSGEVNHVGKYCRLQFDPIRDLVMLIVVAAVVDIVSTTGNLSLELAQSHCGITLRESSGATRKLIFLFGTYPRVAFSVLNTYLDEIEDSGAGLPTPEIVVIPCNKFDVAEDDSFKPAGVLDKKLAGQVKTRRRFLKPQELLSTQTYGTLVARIREELEL
jgi:hypothetical protein